MPVHNCGLHIVEAMESVLGQSYTNLEIIVIDDLSTDDTREIVRNYNDDRIRLIEKREHSGLIASLNLGIEVATGKFIARMDGDDVCIQNRIEKQVEFLESNTDTVLCGSWYQLLPSNELVRTPVENEAIKMAMLDHCAIGHPTVMFTRHFFRDRGLKYERDFFAAEDYDLWTRLAAVGKMANIPEVLLKYRVHANQVTAKEQPAQVRNSDRCKARMLCYPLATIGELDRKFSSIVAGGEKPGGLDELKEVTNWLDEVKIANSLSLFYPLSDFDRYIEGKKQSLIRTFYLNTTSYNPGVLLGFMAGARKFGNYFSIGERIKLALKCMLFWKHGR